MRRCQSGVGSLSLALLELITVISVYVTTSYLASRLLTRPNHGGRSVLAEGFAVCYFRKCKDFSVVLTEARCRLAAIAPRTRATMM